jgi:hypothetical protein
MEQQPQHERLERDSRSESAENGMSRARLRGWFRGVGSRFR